MTLPSRRKRQTIRPNTAGEKATSVPCTSIRIPVRRANDSPLRHVAALGFALALAIQLLPSAASGSSISEEPAARSRDIEKAQHTRLRWRPTRGQAAQANSENKQRKHEVAQHDAAAKSRAKSHAQREANHVKQATATKPVDDPFSDPFFEEDSASKPRLKVEPIARQPRNDNPPADVPMPEEELPAAELPETPSGDKQLEELAQAPTGELPPCPKPTDVKKIREITTDISAQAGEFPPECPLGTEAYVPRAFAPTCYMFKASGLCSKPLYFQQVSVERYGHSWGPILQPFVSGAEFYLTFPILPYLMATYPPTECQYALGYYRPSSCAPKLMYPFPISLRGGLVETGFVFGAIALLP